MESSGLGIFNSILFPGNSSKFLYVSLVWYFSLLSNSPDSAFLNFFYFKGGKLKPLTHGFLYYLPVCIDLWCCVVKRTGLTREQEETKDQYSPDSSSVGASPWVLLSWREAVCWHWNVLSLNIWLSTESQFWLIENRVFLSQEEFLMFMRHCCLSLSCGMGKFRFLIWVPVLAWTLSSQKKSYRELSLKASSHITYLLRAQHCARHWGLAMWLVQSQS